MTPTKAASQRESSEEGRLEAVRRYDILDTPPDRSFDRVTELAAQVFHAPIALVSIVDHDRIWFKSKVGLDIDEVERSPGLCASAILHDSPWIIEDARKDPRALANPLVTGVFGLQFYAGVPLRTRDGHNLGAMCVMDREPRTFSGSDVETLKDLAAIIVGELELRLAARDAAIDAAERLRLLTEAKNQSVDSTVSAPLEGEDIATEHWEDARHWISIYADLITFRVGIIERVMGEMPQMTTESKAVAELQILFIESQLTGYTQRLDLWYQRLWKLHGLWLDPESHMLRHHGSEVALTNREFDLLQFLVAHPGRFYTTEQITGFAWSDSALLPEQVRNYVSRLREILARLDIPCDLVNRPGHGYSIVFRNTD